MYQYAAMSTTRIAPRLLLAYHRTRYAVRATPPFDLKIGATSAALRQWMDHFDARALRLCLYLRLAVESNLD